MKLASRYLHLFRVLLPSWQFFDQNVSRPTLWTREITAGIPSGPWIRGLPRLPRRTLGRLFFNPTENARFAMHALLDQFAVDLSEDKTDSVSEELVQNLVQWLAREHGLGPSQALQFKLTLEDQDIFTSRPC